MRNKLIIMATTSVLACGVFYAPSSQAFNFVERTTNKTAPVKAIQVSAGIEQEAQTFVSIMAQRGIDFLANPNISMEQRRAEFKKLLKSNFDMRTLARFSMGRYWNMATDKQKKEYMSLFEKNVIDVYSKRFGDYQGQEFKVVSAREDGRADAIVSSFIDADGQKISIDWRVRKKKGQMRVIDIIVEGVSMATTQRSEFASIIQRGGGNVQVLLDHLKG